MGRRFLSQARPPAPAVATVAAIAPLTIDHRILNNYDRCFIQFRAKFRTPNQLIKMEIEFVTVTTFSFPELNDPT
jgi:hypothetical protein